MLSNIANLKTSRKLTLLFALFAVAISWVDGLETPSDEYLTEAIKSGAVVYAVARGINGTVSALQGTEISIFALTIAVGEILDPINDLIERFAELLMWVLGSLVLQKILLEIFGHYGFSVLVTSLFLLLSLSVIYARFSAWFNPLLKLFFLTVALHFAVPAAVIASSAVDHIFLKKGDEDRLTSMSELYEELTALSYARPNAPSDEEVAEATIQLDALRDLETDQQKEIDELRRQLDGLSAELDGMRSEVSMVCRLNPLCDEGESINAKKLEIQTKQAELGAAESVNESTTAEIKEQREYLECAAKLQAGKACTFWGRTQSMVSPTEWKQRFNAVMGRMNYYSNDILTLIVSWLTKTILIPLLFLYAFINGYKLMRQKLFAGEEAIEPS